MFFEDGDRYHLHRLGSIIERAIDVHFVAGHILTLQHLIPVHPWASPF